MNSLNIVYQLAQIKDYEVNSEHVSCILYATSDLRPVRRFQRLP